MVTQRAVLVQRVQRMAACYSVPTGHLLESLVRELPLWQAERLLELVRSIDDEALSAAYEWPSDAAEPQELCLGPTGCSCDPAAHTAGDLGQAAGVQSSQATPA